VRGANPTKDAAVRNLISSGQVTKTGSTYSVCPVPACAPTVPEAHAAHGNRAPGGVPGARAPYKNRGARGTRHTAPEAAAVPGADTLASAGGRS
jgi:hypothetical protein